MEKIEKECFQINKLRGKDAGMQKCQACGKEGYLTTHRCTRCGRRVSIRIQHSLKKTGIFLIMALCLYIPSNIFPMFIFKQLGSVKANTIWGGISLLMENKMYGIAVIIFIASIVIPIFKIIGLGLLVLATKYCSYNHVRKYISLYSFIAYIGRWSMLDVFVISTMLTLVHFSPFISVVAGWGASAFGCVVVLTILAAITFDPRLLWDAAEKNRKNKICQNE